MGGNDNGFSNSEIIGRLSAVEATLKNLLDEFRDHRSTTENYRSDNKIVVASLSTSTQGLAKEIAEFKPLIHDHMIKFAEISGAAKFGRVVWTVVVGAGALIFGALGFLIGRK